MDFYIVCATGSSLRVVFHVSSKHCLPIHVYQCVGVPTKYAKILQCFAVSKTTNERILPVVHCTANPNKIYMYECVCVRACLVWLISVYIFAVGKHVIHCEQLKKFSDWLRNDKTNSDWKSPFNWAIRIFTLIILCKRLLVKSVLKKNPKKSYIPKTY